MFSFKGNNLEQWIDSHEFLKSTTGKAVTFNAVSNKKKSTTQVDYIELVGKSKYYIADY